jgi:hypothetical protein
MLLIREHPFNMFVARYLLKLSVMAPVHRAPEYHNAKKIS